METDDSDIDEYVDNLLKTYKEDTNENKEELKENMEEKKDEEDIEETEEMPEKITITKPKKKALSDAQVKRMEKMRRVKKEKKLKQEIKEELAPVITENWAKISTGLLIGVGILGVGFYLTRYAPQWTNLQKNSTINQVEITPPKSSQQSRDTQEENFVLPLNF